MDPILVTGAAGSIGSEVCRLLSAQGFPIVAYDIAETPLFWLHKRVPGIAPIIGSVTDLDHLMRTARTFGVQAIIHAAALKHVGMCDRNVIQAVETNILGTKRVCHAANAMSAQLVFVSTDKAVNPTTVMGATKRIAERVVSQQHSATIVRLVNIWDSAGSLLPMIDDAIAKGKKIELTHPDMERYFMHQDEAAELIVSQLRGARAPGVELVVPNVEHRAQKIAQVIEDRVLSSGVRMEVTIGRPMWGEKIKEELLTARERMAICDGRAPVERWVGKLFRLSQLVGMGEAEAVRAELFKLAGEPS